jgi:polysaccharide export outer membrane protein
MRMFALVVLVAIAMSCARAAEATTSSDAGSPALRMSSALGVPPAPAATAPTPAAPATPVPATAAPINLSRDYRIGPDDLVDVQVFGVDQLTRTVRVNSAGYVSLPLIGVVQLGGFTVQEAEAMIAGKLAANYLQDPQVSVFIKEFTSQRVTIEGAVNRPGIYPLKGSTTLLRSLALAGGQGGLSDMSQVVLFRSDESGHRESRVYDVEKIRRGEIEDPVVVNDDLIVVNRSPSRVFMKDSLFRDTLDAINPFSPWIPK